MTGDGTWIGREVIANGARGGEMDRGRVIAYVDVPSFVIERPDGERFSWRADLTTLAIDEEQVDAVQRALEDVGRYIDTDQARRLVERGVRVEVTR